MNFNLIFSTLLMINQRYVVGLEFKCLAIKDIGA